MACTWVERMDPQDHRDLFVLQELLQSRHPTGVGGLVVFEHDLDLPTV